MTTIVNTPPSTNESGNNLELILGLIILLVVGYLFIVYGLPAVRQMQSPQINIPDKVDINVKQQ